MGSCNHSYKSTDNLLRGLRGLISTVISRVISTMNLQAPPRPFQFLQKKKEKNKKAIKRIEQQMASTWNHNKKHNYMYVCMYVWMDGCMYVCMCANK